MTFKVSVQPAGLTFDVARDEAILPAAIRSGVGLRLGNSRSALGNVVHVDLAVPLDGDASIKNVQFVIETKRSF